MASAKAVIDAFQAANPDITVKMDTRPGGSDGDNLVKTRLSTGDMAEVFVYNNGSLLQAIKPEQNLTPLDDQPWASQLDQTFADSVQGSDGKLYGGPYGTAFGGGVLYNIPVYKKLGLQIPKTWDEFMKNNATIKKAGGIDPVEQTYGDDLDLAAVRARRLPQRRGRRSRTSRRSTPPARPSTPPRRPPWPGSSTSSRSRTPATSTRTSPRPS